MIPPMSSRAKERLPDTDTLMDEVIFGESPRWSLSCQRIYHD